MNLSKYLKIIELTILGFFIPYNYSVFKLSQFILIFLWLISLYAIITIFLLYKDKLSLKALFKTNIKKKSYIVFILIRWLLLSIVLYIFTFFYFFPNKLFNSKNDINLLYKIFLFYPLLSAFPQEFIFCTFFF